MTGWNDELYLTKLKTIDWMSNSSFGPGKLILKIQGMKFFLLSSTGIGIFLLLLKGICRLQKSKLTFLFIFQFFNMFPCLQALVISYLHCFFCSPTCQVLFFSSSFTIFSHYLWFLAVWEQYINACFCLSFSFWYSIRYLNL